MFFISVSNKIRSMRMAFDCPFKSVNLISQLLLIKKNKKHTKLIKDRNTK